LALARVVSRYNASTVHPYRPKSTQHIALEGKAFVRTVNWTSVIIS